MSSPRQPCLTRRNSRLPISSVVFSTSFYICDINLIFLRFPLIVLCIRAALSDVLTLGWHMAFYINIYILCIVYMETTETGSVLQIICCRQYFRQLVFLDGCRFWIRQTLRQTLIKMNNYFEVIRKKILY